MSSMKCPNKGAGLPDMPPFPHEYHRKAEYLLRMCEYNMRVRIWDFIRAATKTDPDGKVSVEMVLAMAVRSQAAILQGQADDLYERTDASDATDQMLKDILP